MKVYLSNIENNEKPSEYMTKKISNTIMKNLKEISIQDLAIELAEKGKTVVLAELKDNILSKTTPIISQEVVMLDFDNKDENNLYTLEDFEQDSFMQEHSCFIYRTFSDMYAEVDKFRVVFVLDKVITENKDIDKIYGELIKRYPQADKSVGQTSRLFFGSKSGYDVIDFDNKLDTSEIVNRESDNEEKNTLQNFNFKAEVYNPFVEKALDISPKIIEGSEIFDYNTPNYLLLKMRRFDIVKEKMGNLYSRIFPDDYNAFLYFKTLEIKEFLELPDENPFIDILHDEIKPSASVFYSDKFNCYLYKCFSSSHNFTGSLIDLLSEYLDTDDQTVTKMLVDITNSKVTNNTLLGQIKFNSETFSESLLKGDLEYSHPELYKFLKRYSLEIYFTMKFMFNHVNQDLEGEYVYLNYYNRKTLTKLVSKATKKNITESKMRNILNVIVVTEIIRKLPDREIPKDIYDSLIEPQKNESKNLRVSNLYQPNNLDKEFRNKMSEIAKVLNDSKVTVGSLSFELIYRLFGEEKANQDFEQSFKPLIERGVKMSSSDKNLTKSSVSLEKSAIKIIMDSLDSQGYIYEQDIIKILSRTRGTTQAVLKQRYDKIRMDVVHKYGLERRRLNKEIYNKLGVKESFSTKVVLFRK